MTKTTFEHKFNIGDVVWVATTDLSKNEYPSCGLWNYSNKMIPQSFRVDDIYLYLKSNSIRYENNSESIYHLIGYEEDGLIFATKEECQAYCDKQNGGQNNE